MTKEVATLFSCSVNTMKNMGHASYNVAIVLSSMAGYTCEQTTLEILLNFLAKLSALLDEAGIKLFAWTLSFAEKALREEGDLTKTLLRRI